MAQASLMMLLLLLLVLFVLAQQNALDCTYAIHIVTGCEYGAGTSNVVGVTFRNASAPRQLVGPSVVSFYNLNREPFEPCSSNDFVRTGRCVESITTMELLFFNSHAGPSTEDWFLESLEVEVRQNGQQTQPFITFTVHKWLHARNSADNVFSASGGSRTDPAELAAFEKGLVTLLKSVQESVSSQMTKQIGDFLAKINQDGANFTSSLHRALADVQAPNLSAADTIGILQALINTVYQSCLSVTTDAAQSACQVS